MSDNIDNAFNWLDARIARLRQSLEKMIEDNVQAINRAVGNRTITPSVAEAIKKAEKKNSSHLYKFTADNVREIENEAIKTFGLSDDHDTRVNLRTYTHEKINA